MDETIRKHAVALLAALVVAVFARPAFAWPGDGQWRGIMRGGALLQDPNGDAAGSRNIVSDPTRAPLFLYNNGVNVFFRLRLDQNPAGTGGQGMLQSFGWGVLLDTNGNPGDYEYMIMLDGISKDENIAFWRNTIQGVLGDPSDRPEILVASYPLVTNGNYRIVPADSAFNGDQDFFLDWLIPYAILKTTMGVTDHSPLRLFGGSSPSANNLTQNGGDLLGASDLYTGFSDVFTPLGITATTGVARFIDGVATGNTVTTAGPGDTLLLRVDDFDMNANNASIDRITVIVRTQGGDTESVTLVETGVNTGVFIGALPTAASFAAAVPGDGTLQSPGAETVTLLYTDPVDATGKTNQPRTAVLTFTVVTGVTGSVRFVDDLAGGGDATTILPGEFIHVRIDDADLNRNAAAVETVVATVNSSSGDTESVTLTETGANTGVFTVRLATSTAAGALNDGTLRVAPGGTARALYVDALDAAGARNQIRIDLLSIAAPTGITGTIRFVADAAGNGSVTAVVAGATIHLRVDDADLNLDPAVAESVTVTVTSTGTNDAQAITLTETGPSTGIFVGSLATATGAAQAGNGVLETQAGATLTAVYLDALDAEGLRDRSRTATLTVHGPPPPGGPSLVMTKTVDRPGAKPGETLTYTIHYRNAGAGGAKNVTLRDGVPQNTDFVPGSLRAGGAGSTYGTATPRTDAAGDDDAECDGVTVVFRVGAVAADDGIAGAGDDEGKIFYRAVVR